MTRRVRVYGRLNGNGSMAQVTRGFVEALTEFDRIAGIVALDRDVGPEEPGATGADAHHAVFTGPHALVSQMMTRGAHEQRWVMLAPNSDLVPPRLLGAIQANATHILVPSRWAATVLESQSSMPIVVVPHGVSSAFRPDAEACDEARSSYERGAFRVIHFSTSDRQRKTTLELVEAWSTLMLTGKLPQRASLHLVLDFEALGRYYEWVAEQPSPPPSVFAVGRIDSNPAAMSRSLCHAHVVAQPSRGEGFGMLPLEARACGVPVVATACTGHSEHISIGDPGVVVVEHGDSAPIDDFPGAKAPSVTPEAIASALVEAHGRWPELQDAALANADRVSDAWCWSKQLAPWIDSL